MAEIDEIKERLAILEGQVFGMSREAARIFLDNYSEALKSLSGSKLESYVEANRQGASMAEKVLGV